MFGKIKKDQIRQNNQGVENELGSDTPMPPAEPDFKDKALHATGTALTLTGLAAGVIAIVGGATLALSGLVGMFGLSTIITLLILTAIAGLAGYFGPKLLMPQPLGV